MCEKINSNQLKQATLTAQLVKFCCSVLVKNIESADVDEEFLELYFNNSKLSGGCNVQDVKLIGGGMAVITFEDYKGIAMYLPCIYGIVVMSHNNTVAYGEVKITLDIDNYN